MIRISSNPAKAMEFTRFRKKESIADDELLFAALKFEKALLQKEDLIFHCMVRNYDNEYANVLFGDSISQLKDLENNLGHLPEVKNFFELIDIQSVNIEYHEIQKENFLIPEDFCCIEKGTFSLNNINDSHQILKVSENIENKYLNTFENTKAHFIGNVDYNVFSEITFGKTLASTKQICFGYFDNSYCKNLLSMADTATMKLDFWYLIA